MLKIAELIKIATDEEQTASVKKEVEKLSREFQNIEYCFKN
jgi:hypothetical protein